MGLRVEGQRRPYPWNPKNGLKLNWSLDESQKQGWNNFGWVKKSENNYGVQNIPMSYSSKIPETIFFWQNACNAWQIIIYRKFRIFSEK